MGRARGHIDHDDSDTEEESRRWRMGVRIVYSGTPGQLLVPRSRFHTPPARSEREPAVRVAALAEIAPVPSMICFVGCYGSYPGGCRLARRAGSPPMPPLCARRRSAPDWPFMSDAEFKSSFKNKISKWETGYKQTPQIKTTGPSATPPTASKPAPRTAPSTPAATQEEAPGPPTTGARAPWDAATQAPPTT